MLIQLKDYIRTSFQTYLPVIKTAVNARQLSSEKGQPNGYASLGADGKIPSSQVPDIAISEFLGTAADEATMLGYTGQKGDWCTRSDESKDYILIDDDATQLSSWRALTSASNGVDSFNGRTGAVTPQVGDYSKADVGLGNVDNTSDADKPISTATQTALDNKEDSLGNPDVDGKVLSSTAAGARSWVTVSSGATSIDDLTDVDISTTAPTDNQVLKWDNANSKFVPDDVADITSITSSEATDDWNNA